MKPRWRIAFCIGCAALFLLTAGQPFAADVDFIERFALAEDREEVLQELIPGTEDYYYYHCVHYQNAGRLDEVDGLLETWIERHKRTGRVREIQNRQALLRYGDAPSESLEYLRHELGLRFSHQREVTGQKSSLPTALDESLISRETLTKRALDRQRYRETVRGFEDSALDWLITRALDEERTRDLLQRLERPDYDVLPKLIAADLDAPHSGEFGSIEIHRRLLLDQLDTLLDLKPDLLNQTNFVNVYLTKLRPNADVDWPRDEAAREAYLDRLETFVSHLNPSHNSLKAHVLYQRLVHDRGKGVYDADRFMAYITLPRRAVYMDQDFMRRRESQTYAANLNQDFQPQTQLPLVGDDEPLVRSYLAHFFLEEDSYRPYERCLDDNYLREVFAETKILHGLGDMEKWYSWLSPAKYQALKDRVDIEFDHANPRTFAVDEPVHLDVWVKNADTLIVKVFEINTENYYRRHLREVNTDIDLDGLVANEEKTYTYDAVPLRCARRRFTFPNLDHRGVYIIELIGNGKSSRALVRKGRLHHVVRTSVAGHVFTVLDESRRPLADAAIWLAGHEYTPDEDGAITVPFTAEPGRQPIVLSLGGFACLDYFSHESEEYALSAGIYVDRESLRRGGTASVLVRPALYVNGTPVMLSILENPALVITSQDRDKVSTSKEIRDFELSEERESVHEFRVPDDIVRVTFTLKGEVERLSRADKVPLAVSKTFELNQIDATDKIDALHLSRGKTGTVPSRSETRSLGTVPVFHLLELLDKTGRPKAGRPVGLVLKHRDFRDPVHATLQTDAAGRIQLGELEDIAWIKAMGPDGVECNWNLIEDQHSYPDHVHGKAGEPVRVAYMGAATTPRRSELSLLELRGPIYFRDRFDALRIEDGFVIIAGLAAGDYELFLKRPAKRILVRVTDGVDLGNHILSESRHLGAKNRRPLQIASIQAGEIDLEIRLANSSAFSRVHVLATRFVPAYSLYENLNTVAFAEPSARFVPILEAAYVSGRNIGDEYRYVLERKYAQKYPGNMLERPGVLINPWAIRKTETARQEAEAGEPPAAAPMAPPPTEALGKAEAAVMPGGVDYANLDFLSGDAVVLLNLEPDEDGVVRVSRADLGGRQHVQVAAVDPANTVYREVSLEEGAIPFRDLRLMRNINPETHATEQKQITPLAAGEALTIEDITTSQLEVYDTLGKVYALYVTLSGDPNLVEFNFVTRWPNLSNEEKRETYSKHACHELNFFLSKKDPQFFQSVVQPFIRNKRDKTFLDEWLLGADLRRYLEPWAHAQVNIVERILLAEHIDGERRHTIRHVSDLYNLLPPDIERRNHLFMTALGGSALDVSRGVALGEDLWFYANARERGEKAKALEHRLVAEYTAGDRKRARPRAAAEGVSEELSMAIGLPAAETKADLDEADKEYDDPGDLRRRAGVRQLYQALDKTEEWVENNYYHLPIEAQNADLITVNAFWRDYAERDPGAPFLSPDLAEASRNFPEMMFALAVLDLPFKAGEHKTQLEGERFTLEAAGPTIVFHKEIKEAEPVAETTPILVSQNFFRHGDRYRYENNERIDKFVADEFLAEVVYGCQVAVTNPTPSRQKLDVLLQVPRGAIAVLSGKYTKSVNLDLQPYSTQAIEYYFYFPEPGRFEHFPVHVAKNEDLIACAEPREMNVVWTPSRVDTTSWDYISQNGQENEVLAYLNRENLGRVNLGRIAWRMRDRAFFDAVLELLVQRHLYDPTLWSYGIYHNDVPTIRTFLQHADHFVEQCGALIDSELLTIDPVIRKAYQHMEYSPLVNARAHRLGATRKILNDRFAQQYARLMNVLTYRPALDHDDLMAVTYYLLLQDRVEEGLEFFGKVRPEALATALQYDYFAAYGAFYTGELDTARATIESYADYPVDRWRKLFDNVRSQLDEIEGARASMVDDESHAQRQAQLASTEPNIEFQVEANQIAITYQNVVECRVNYYLMDVELLFSTNPFAQQHAAHFSTILPNFSETIALPEDDRVHSFELPDQFRNKNVVIELEAAGVERVETYFASSLAVQIIENYGQVKVTHQKTGKPLAKVYVKVFARMQDGRVRFYKDGYTDLRGRFDYTSLNTNELDFVKQFALLILSETDGAVVREANPPKR